MSGFVPNGFRMTGVSCGIKTVAGKNDLALIVADRPCVAAGVYTQNRIFAAPVAVDRARTPSDRIRVIVANSGNANACTGERGLRDAQEMGRLAAAEFQAADDAALVLSTGIIGEFLPMEKIAMGVRQAAGQLGDDESSFRKTAHGIMTTDRNEKIVHRSCQIDGRTVKLAGMAKGAGMIGPNMATMLGIVLTDAHARSRIRADRAETGRRCKLQLHQRGRTHEYQRHAVAVGQRRGGRSTPARTALWKPSQKHSARPALSWRE